MVKIPLARPVLGDRERELAIEVIDSGVLSLGPYTVRFERDFAAFMGASHAVAVSSGTAALHLGIRALGVEAGDEVITTPFSFVSSANCIEYERARPVFVDIEPSTLNIDPAAIEAAITAKTKAVLPVHMFGMPADMDAIERTAKEHNLAVLEDACEALGAVHTDGTKVGARGNIACFGFYPNKQLATGEGGMLTCADMGIRDRLASERNQGRGEDMGVVNHVRLGYNYRIDELSAALGVAQMERLAGLLEDRRRVASIYNERLKGVEGPVLPEAESHCGIRSWFVYVVQLPEEVNRAKLIEALGKAGIASKAYLPAIHLMPYYREKYGYSPGDFPHCERAAESSLALPFYPGMSEEEVEKVSDTLIDRISNSSHNEDNVYVQKI